MSYTRPSASAANASWSGASAYTRPSAGAANATFIDGSTYNAEGFQSTQYGAPTAIWDQFGYPEGFIATQYGTPQARQTQYADGFQSTQYGTPDGSFLYRAAGFQSTQYGEPRLFPYHQAPWPVSTQVGTPTGKQVWHAASLGTIAKYGIPTTPTHQVCVAEGFIRTQYGTPVSWRYAPGGRDIICRAQGFRLTQYGTPVASWSQSGEATGFSSTAVGTPRAIMTFHVPSIGPVAQYGTPQARQTQRAQGFKAAAIGTPQSRRTQYAADSAPRTRYGTHSTIRGNWYVAYGFRATKYGTPRAWQRFNYHVGEWTPATQVGTPSSRRTYPATSIPPITRYGTPLLKRTTQC